MKRRRDAPRADSPELPFTVARRDEVIAQMLPLPGALRCPPWRSASEFVLRSLADDDGELRPNARAWLECAKNQPRLERLAAVYRANAGPSWPPPFSISTFNSMVRQTLLGLQPGAPQQNTTYAITKRLRLLHDARRAAAAGADVAAGISREDAAFRQMCVLDHYTRRTPGRWFQLHLLYRLVLKLEEIGVLHAEPGAAPRCPICFTGAEGGQEWHHLEPCRHWLCAACGDEYMQERAQHSCPQCRALIVCYVRA